LAGVSARILTEKDKWERVAQCLHLRKLSTTSRESRRRVMSKMKEWLLDKQINGDDGAGYCDTCAGCDNCVRGEASE
jgi:hypothetical protein